MVTLRVTALRYLKTAWGFNFTPLVNRCKYMFKGNANSLANFLTHHWCPVRLAVHGGRARPPLLSSLRGAHPRAELQTVRQPYE